MPQRLAVGLKKTVFHPQWLVLRKDNFASVRQLGLCSGEVLLDIGCGRGELRARLPEGVHYLGLDYPATGVARYAARPDILASAEGLPVMTAAMDAAVMFEVLEHLPEPGRAINELARVLKPGGRALVTVPFAYPIHDAPFDFQRLTRYQLSRMTERAGLWVDALDETGHGLESAALLANLAAVKCVLDGIQRRHPIALAAPLLLIAVPLFNVLGWLGAKLAGSCGGGFLPMGYRLLLSKPGLE